MTIRNLYDAGGPHTPASAAAWAEAVSDTADLAGLTIVEITTGVWSADAPARDPGANPVEFRSVTDPADPTDGIATPANINARDRWVQLDSL